MHYRRHHKGPVLKSVFVVFGILTVAVYISFLVTHSPYASSGAKKKSVTIMEESSIKLGVEMKTEGDNRAVVSQPTSVVVRTHQPLTDPPPFRSAETLNPREHSSSSASALSGDDQSLSDPEVEYPIEEDDIFPRAFTKPLDKDKLIKGRQQIAKYYAKRAKSSKNGISKLYEAYEPSQDDEAFFDEDFWDQHKLLRDTLKRYQTMHAQMLDSKVNKAGRAQTSRKKVVERFVGVHPVGQLCNRLMAITSAFVFGLVTGRALLVDDAGFYAQSSDLFELPGFAWLWDDPYGGRFTDSHFLQNPESGVWGDMEPLLCSDYAGHYHKKHVTFSINQYMVPYIQNNPHYREALIELFGGTDIFHPIARFLFRPVQKIIKMRDNFIREHFAGHFVVGMQVRSGGDFTDHFMSQADWFLYRDCAYASTPSSVRKSMKFFVATDTDKGRASAKQFLEDRKPNWNGGDPVVEDWHKTKSDDGRVIFGPGRFKLSNNPEGVQMALLDLLLLAAADDRVTTAWSSYGYFASGYSSFPANMVVDKAKYIEARHGEEQRFMGVMHKSDKRVQCVRLPTHQPCFHKFESWGASKASCFKSEWFEREMMNGRYC